MDPTQISSLASQLRAASVNKNNILTLSATTLSHLCSSLESLEEPSTSFNVKQPPSERAELIRDLQYLHNYIRNAKTFKLYADFGSEDLTVNVSPFSKLLSIEFCKIDVNIVKGLQVLRPQLQRLVCQKVPNCLNDILGNCGADKTLPYTWNELKEASFLGSKIEDLGQSLECAPWLHTLDLSHNEISNIEALNCLPNLKYLNLAYNRLEVVPPFKGQICSRLQNLILKNNFIEDISGLRSLNNLWLLDLSDNSLIDHKCLLYISHLATLQCLNLQGNPLTFHPNHRSKTSSYLHANTSSTNFVLNQSILTKNEKKLVGSYYPLQAKSLTKSTSLTESVSLSVDKSRRVREVVIEEEDSAMEVSPLELPATPRQYLETKKQIEDLHEKFGESWLNSRSGLLDVLGLESSSVPLGTSPYEADFSIYSGDFTPQVPEEQPEQAEEVEVINEEYDKPEEPPVEEDIEPDVEGEESIYLATVKGDLEPVFIVLGPSHLSERECSTGNEKEKWHLDSIISCEITEEEEGVVQVNFETMRKDRKQRLYVFKEEMEAFVACIKNKINSRSPKKEVEVRYLCMKCSNVFGKKNASILKEDVLKCPNCDSNLVVEDI